jgi:serine/threonine-protein kinase HipA
MDLTLQIYVDGYWHDAAQVGFERPEQGISSPASVSYDVNYWADLSSVDAQEGLVIDRRALSLRYPVDMNLHLSDKWPAWLLDIMPQGVARTRIAQDAGLRGDSPALDIRLLQRAGGAPIGNMRIKEAFEDEQERIANAQCPPLTDEDIHTCSEKFLDVVDRFAYLASGSSGVQGEWPKALMTRSARDGFWYPDPFVATEDGIEHAIIKLLKSSSDKDRLILEAEAPYLELARDFGLNCAAALIYEPGVLIMPRFDREVEDGNVRLHGQESMTSALGIADFGVPKKHEDYLEVIDLYSDNPVADRIEYLLRDVLNMAAGNPDNHGRNTAMQRPARGGVKLAPLFDFAPMRLSDAGIARQTRWRCLHGQDLGTDWSAVCEAVACDGLSTDQVREELIGVLPQLRVLRETAERLGVPHQVIERAINPEQMITAIESLEEYQCQP